MTNLKKKFMMSPYLIGLGSMLLSVLTVVMMAVVFVPTISEHGLDLNNPEGHAFFLLLALYILMWVALVVPYEAFGYMEIQENAVLFRHPFRGRRKLLFSEIKYIGIDYGVISGGMKQFWIYFSKEPIPRKYLHNMNKMPLSKQTMRIQYRRKVFDALVYYLPKDLSKRLNANYSIIRLYKSETD